MLSASLFRYAQEANAEPTNINNERHNNMSHHRTF